MSLVWAIHWKGIELIDVFNNEISICLFSSQLVGVAKTFGNHFDALVLTGLTLPLADPASTLTALIAHGLRIVAEHGPDRCGKHIHLTHLKI